MRHERHACSVLVKSQKYLLLVCASLILCCSQSIVAQSGRRAAQPKPAPTPVAVTSTETAKPERPVVSSIIVGGDLIHDIKKYGDADDNIKDTIKICMERLNYDPPMEVINGGKMNLNQAKERAKKETKSYVLWFELSVKFTDDYLMEPYLVFIDYAVLMPQTAKFLTSGRVYPSDHKNILSESVLRVPTIQRGPDLDIQLMMVVPILAARAKAKF
ncbi:MAG: hypothetical protein ICV60_21155 [Pyrinomonadaceae bacterium]|nr:hypothetical protein [Pyrinomonadaceae bacterium]